MLNAKHSLLITLIISSIMSIPVVERTKRHLETLDEYCRKYSIIGKYSKELRYLLYDSMTFQTFPANKFLTVQGRPSVNQYLILEGIARLQTMPPVRKTAGNPNKKVTDTANARQPITISFLSAGDAFGEFGMIREPEFRPQNISVVSASQIHVLVFEKEKMLNIINDLESKFTEKQLWLNGLPGFKNLPRFPLLT
jgi:CRP-like cAMP-binding protein